MRLTNAAGVAELTGIQRRKRLQVVSEHARTVAPRITVWRVVAWVGLIIIINVAVGRALQVAAENVVGRGEASEPAQSMDVVYPGGACEALDGYARRTLTIDELHDLQDQLCPTLSEPQRTGN